MNEKPDELNKVLIEKIGIRGIDYILDLMASLIETSSTNLNCPESLVELCMWKVLTPSLFNFQDDAECETGLLLIMLKEIYNSIKDDELKKEIDKYKHGIL